MSDLKNTTILSTVKSALGLNPDEIDPDFDTPIRDKINTAIGKLAQLGLGELGSFLVSTGDETWNDFLGEEYLFVYAFATNYISVFVKLNFDIPQSGSEKAALDEEFKIAEQDVMTAIELYNIEKEATL